MNILVVDDDNDIGRMIAEFVKRQGHRCEYAGSGEEAINFLSKNPVDLVLLDIIMPGMDGIETLREIKHIDQEITVVMITGRKEFDLVRKSLQLGAFDYVVKPVHPEDLEFLLKRVEDRVSFLNLRKNYQKFLEEKVQEQTLKIKKIFLGSIASLINTIEAKDPYHRDHSERVSRISVELGKRMGLSNSQIESLSYAGLLHDIGKVGIPDRILLKPSELTPEEYEIIKRHPGIGVNILKPLIQEKAILDGVLYHHERYDGNGFPDGLSGENIPLFGRIIDVADAIEAMTSERPYRPKLTIEETIDELKKHSGKQFDPEIAEIAINYLEENHEE